jgi:hypothetical protein
MHLFERLKDFEPETPIVDEQEESEEQAMVSRNEAQGKDRVVFILTEEAEAGAPAEGEAIAFQEVEVGANHAGNDDEVPLGAGAPDASQQK